MNSAPSNFGTLLKSAFLLLAIWLAYQSVTARDFTAPSTANGTAPILR